MTGHSYWYRSDNDDAAMHRAFWSLNEALAWILTGDIAIVSGVADCERHYFKQGSNGSVSAWSEIDFDAAFYQPTTRRDGWIYDAAEELRCSCAAATLEALGCQLGSDLQEVISPSAFDDALLGPGLNGQLSRITSAEYDVIYHDLMFKADGVRGLRRQTAARGPVSRGVGRPKGPGFKQSDVPLFKLMRPLIEQGVPHLRAAKTVAPAQGKATSFNSDVDRLRTTYKFWEAQTSGAVED